MDSETMSTTEPIEAPVEPSVEDTQTEPVEAAPEEPGERYPVKIGGEEHEVTLEELRNGYQRQSDYTKKTQELADLRKQLAPYEALASALEKDPLGTLKALNEAYKVSDEKSAEWDEMDPQEQRLVRLERDLEQQRTREARAQIEREFKSLEDQYGEIDRQKIAAFAYKNDYSVTDAYKLMHFEDVQKQAQKQATTAEREEAKRNAQLPHQGGSAQRGALQSSTAGKKMSIREAYDAALKQVG